MEARDLRYFLKAVELESLSRAAAALGVTQPALSRQVRALEHELGQHLLRRTGRGVLPTQAGQRVAAEAARILADLDALRDILRRRPAAPVGAVALALPASMNESLLPELYAALRQRFPGIALRVAEAATATAIDLLKAREVDVAILHDRSDFTGLTVQTLIDEPVCLITAAGQAGPLHAKVPLSMLQGADLILPSARSGLRALLEAEATRQGIRLNVTVELDAVATIKNLVVAGLGQTVLPAFSVIREQAAGLVTVQRIGDPPLARRLVIAHLAHRPQSFAVRAVIAAVRELAAHHAATTG